MLKKFSQGDGAPKAVVQAFLRSRLSKKKKISYLSGYFWRANYLFPKQQIYASSFLDKRRRYRGAALVGSVT
jgi:hypothetical protein